MIRSVYVVASALVPLSIVQGEAGPLAFLGTIYVTAGAAATALAAASMLVLFGTSRRSVPVLRRAVVVTVCVVLFWAIVSGIAAAASEDQWLVLATYALLFACSLAAPPQIRMLPLYGFIWGSAIQVLAVLIARDFTTTTTGVSQLSGGVQPNLLALQASVVACASLVYALDRTCRAKLRLAALLGAIIFTVATVLTVSRSGLIALLIGVALTLLLTLRTRALIALASLGTLALVAVLSGLFKIAALETWFIRGDRSSLTSLTGRTDIWDLSLSYFLERPIMGWGFGGLYDPAYSAGDFLLSVHGTNTHNVALQVLVELGIMGLVGMSILVLLTAYWCVRHERKNALCIAMLTILLVNGTVSASFATIGVAACLFAALLALVGGESEGLSKDSANIQPVRRQNQRG